MPKLDSNNQNAKPPSRDSRYKNRLGNVSRSNVQSQPQIVYKEPVPKASEPNYLKPRQEVNYVRENHDRVINEKPKSVVRTSQEMGKPQPQHKNHGKVPQYIDKYKQ
jgi:hypothetical protein